MHSTGQHAAQKPVAGAGNTPNQKDDAGASSPTTNSLSSAFGCALPQTQLITLGDRTWVSGPHVGTIVSMHRQTYGFISAQSVQPFDIYFACGDVESTTRSRLRPGTVVEFDLHRIGKDNRRGLRALVRSKVKTARGSQNNGNHACSSSSCSSSGSRTLPNETTWKRRTYKTTKKVQDVRTRRVHNRSARPAETACPVVPSVRYAKGPTGRGFMFERKIG